MARILKWSCQLISGFSVFSFDVADDWIVINTLYLLCKALLSLQKKKMTMLSLHKEAERPALLSLHKEAERPAFLSLQM